MSSLSAFALTMDFKQPDFAYPQNVVAQADSLLKVADKLKGTDADLTRLMAVMERVVAQTSIDADNSFAQPAFVAAQAEKAGLTSAGRAMLLAYEAGLYNAIYSANKYKYDKVDAPLEPYPADVALWSGQQFRTRIFELLAQAAGLAGAEPLSTFKPCLSYSDQALMYLPTVADFIRNYRLDIYQSIASSSEEYQAERQNLCSQGIADSQEFSAPYYYWKVKEVEQGNPNTTFEDLTKLYKSNADKEVARFVLYNIADSDNQDLVPLLKESLAKFPNWYGNDLLSNRLKYLTRATASATVPSLVAVDKDFKVEVKYSYAKNITVYVYEMPANADSYDAAAISKRMARISSQSFETEGEKSTKTVTLRIPSPGNYAVVLEVDGLVGKDSRATAVQATPLLGFTINGCRQYVGVAVDFITGAPVAGVSVDLNTRVRNLVTNTNIGKTDKDGTVRANAPTKVNYNSSWLSFKYQNRTYDFNRYLWVNGFSTGNSKDRNRITVMTDRALYHPGDSIEWAFVAATIPANKQQGTVIKGAEFEVVLKDANYQEVERRKVTTDNLGRAYGAFATQKGSLTGSYTIMVTDKTTTGTSRVMVSDFKAPVFEVTVNSVKRDVPARGAVTLEGQAKTYAGMPVPGANVAISLTGATRWRWFVPQTTLGTYNVTTDTDGKFSIEFPPEVLDRTFDGNKFTNFITQISVTTSAGETANTSKNFTTGKPYDFVVKVPEMANSDNPITFDVQAYNADGQLGAVPMKWTLNAASDDMIVARGEGISGQAVTVDKPLMKSGKYYFYVYPANQASADDFKSNEFIVYSFKNNTLPSDIEALFLPSTTLEVNGGKGSVTVGSNVDDLYVYPIVSQGDKLLPVVPQKIKYGFTDLKVNIPAGELDDVSVTLVAVRDGKMMERLLTIAKPAKEEFEVTMESFRDNLTPGATETWRIRLHKGSQGIAGAGVIATMYNKALDDLYSGSWPSNINIYKYHRGLDIKGVIALSGFLRYAQEIAQTGIEYISWPQFLYMPETYSFGSAVKYYSIAPRNMAMKTMATGAVDYEVAVAEDAEEEVNGAVSVDDAGQEAASQDDYREIEALQALWKPALVTDADGNVDLVFTVPNAIGTWQFRAFGWDTELNAASVQQQALANKPVMVHLNTPRYLRQGDQGTVLATIYNNTDSVVHIKTLVETFNVGTMEVQGSAIYENTVEAKGSATIDINAIAVPTLSALGFRVRSTAGSFSDGEQGAIVILPSSTAVIESSEFYLNPTDSTPFEISMDVPELAVVNLQYCQNPIWTIIKAMRWLSTSGMSNATTAVSQLFSALAGKQIVESNPTVAEVLKQWKENPSEDALTSMLSRNEDIKKLLLNQTPWVLAASSQTQRMDALTEFLAPDNTQNAINECVEALKKLQNSDGGFAWGAWNNQSSVWATETVLTTLGIARSMGLLPAIYDTMMQNAFNYLQAEAAKPNRPDTDRSLAFIASMFPQFKQTVAGEKIIRATVTKIAKGWKKDDVVGKAYDVMILNANGRKALAQEVLESIRQFGVTKPGMGLTFPSVTDIRGYATIIQAFATMDATAAELDAMRQWIIVRAQAMDDLGTYNPDYIVAAVMLTGSDWTSVPVEQNVTVNGKPLNIDKMESASGYFSQSIAMTNGDNSKINISVKPNGTTPSYGSVITIKDQPMKSVAARPGRDLSIDKRFLVELDGQWVVADTFKFGERVRVQLVVQAKRDLEYVSIDDERPSAFEPVEQMPGWVRSGGLSFYRENGDSSTRLFVNYLPKGSYYITYDMTVMMKGCFVSGIATLQSQYAPELTAHSAGQLIISN